MVVVTGASGIAAAAARSLADHGADVFVVSLDADECQALCAELEERGARCGWSAVDLRDEESTEAAFRQARRELGPIQGLLAVAGGSGRRHGDGPLHEVPLDGWQATFEINAVPAFLAAREAIRSMLEEGRPGSVVLVSSVLARHPSPSRFATHAYASAKGALGSLTRTLAAYYAPQGIRVNAIAPGLVDTPMAARAAGDPEIVSYAERKQPLARGLLTPEHVAEVGSFLLSPGSAMITGQVIEVDGGWGVTEAAP